MRDISLRCEQGSAEVDRMQVSGANSQECSLLLPVSELRHTSGFTSSSGLTNSTNLNIATIALGLSPLLHPNTTRTSHIVKAMSLAKE
jgi:hypothetical protein